MTRGLGNTFHHLWCWLVVICFLSGTQCEDLGGRWYNQLGSVLVLHHSQDGELTGTYETQVEQKHGSAGNAHSHIVVGRFMAYVNMFMLDVSWVYTQWSLTVNIVIGTGWKCWNQRGDCIIFYWTEIIWDGYVITLISSWLYYQGDHNVRFDCIGISCVQLL